MKRIVLLSALLLGCSSQTAGPALSDRDVGRLVSACAGRAVPNCSELVLAIQAAHPDCTYEEVLGAFLSGDQEAHRWGRRVVETLDTLCA